MKTVSRIGASKQQRIFMVRTANIYRHQTLRAHKSHTGLNYTLEDFRRWVRKDLEEAACSYCAAPLTLLNFSADHRLPTSRGGSYQAANLVIVCERCNQCKGPLTDEEYLDLLVLLNQWLPQPRQNVLSRLRAGGRVVRSS